MLMELVAAGVVGVALLWLVLQPLLTTEPLREEIDLDPLDPEETAQGIALIALKEIEFDRATGKLSDADYHELNARYTAAALAVLDTPAGTLQCQVHGARPEVDAVFCSDCGAVLVTADGHCAECGFAVPAGSAFCPGCGRRAQ